MSYTQVFGGTTLYPSDVSYLALTLDVDKALEWPLESNDPANPAASVIDVTSSGSRVLTLPDATLTAAGQTILFNNLSASTSSFTVKDYAGGTLATVAVGEQWQVYLAGTTTAAGTWRVFRYGASTATVQASALAGYGVTVTSGTLSQSTPVTTFNTSPRTVLTTDRASMLVWNGTGAGVLNLPSAAAVGNNYIVSARNSGGGDLTLAAAGSETIDGLSTLALHPGDSTSLATNGVVWYTLGLGQQSVFAFDYTSITVTGGNYTLSGSELNRIAYEFVGALTSDVYIIVPPTIQQYWISNATSGAYSLYMRTASGAPVAVSQGARGIYYCNGANVVDADTSTVALPISAANGGTGITSYTIGDLVYANSATTLTKLSDVAVGNALLSGGVGVAPSWGKVDLTTHVTGTLPVTSGGTGANNTATARTNLGATIAGTNFFTLTNPSAVTFVRINADNTVSTLDAATFRTAIGAGSGGGSVTSVDVSGGTTGLTTSGGPITGSGTITMGGTLGVASGGTGQSSYAIGDLLYASTATALSKLADVATGNALISGGVGVAPSWGKIGLTTHISGTLPIANGGTNLTATPTNGQVLIGNGTGYTLAAITQGSGITVTNGAGTITVANAAPMVYPGAGIAVSTGSAWSTSLTAPSGTIVGTSDTQTLTNKRVNPRVGTVLSSATITPNADISDQHTVTALALGATIAAPSGTPVDGQKLMLRIKDNGTGQTLSWTTSAGGYRIVGTTLPTTTVATKTLYVGCIYNSADGFWDVVAVAQQA